MTSRLSRCLPLFILVLAQLPLHAQIKTTISSRHSTYLVYQPFTVEFVVENTTGQFLRLGGEKANVEFHLEVKGPTGRPVEVLEPFTPEEFVLRTQDSHRFSMMLTRHFKMREPGPYVVQARFENQTHEFPAQKWTVDILNGTPVSRSISTLTGRTFILMSLLRREGEFLFVQVEDAKGDYVHGVYELGRFLRFNTPSIMFDAEGALHILHSYEPKNFAHSVFDSYGKPISQEYYREEYASVLLRMNDDGKVLVTGGQRRGE